MVEMLEALVADTNGSGTLSDLKLTTACLLGYAEFFRFQEIVDLRACDCTIGGKMLTVYIENNQLRQGNEVLIASTGTSKCPVAMLEHHVERTGIKRNDKCFLFQAIQNTKNGEVLRQSGKISYTSMSDLHSKKLASLGFLASKFGLHSLR